MSCVHFTFPRSTLRAFVLPVYFGFRYVPRALLLPSSLFKDPQEVLLGKVSLALLYQPFLKLKECARLQRQFFPVKVKDSYISIVTGRDGAVTAPVPAA